MVTARLTAGDCNPGVVSDLVMLNNAVLTALARCGYEPMGGSFMHHSYYVQYDQYGFISILVNDREVIATIGAANTPTLNTILNTLVDQLGLKTPDIKVVD